METKFRALKVHKTTLIIPKEHFDYVIDKYCNENKIVITALVSYYKFLAFHTMEQAKLFLAENTDLINDYLMM